MISTGHGVDDEQVLCGRLSQFGLFGFALASALFALHGTVTWSGASVWSHFRLEVALSLLLLALALLAIWRLIRRGGWSLGGLRMVEVVLFATGAIGFAAAAYYMPATVNPDLVLLVVFSHAMILRALFVPSTGARTAAFAALLALPFAIVSFHHAAQASTPRVVLMSAWWLSTSVVCCLVSNVVYGLRRQVSRATRLGQYTLEEKLGEGGMGMVYRARHEFLKRPTAVKVLRADHSSDRDLARFEREVQLTSKLTHPNTVKVYDYGQTADGLFYYAMELLEGASLNDIVMADGPQPLGRVARVMWQVAGALGEAHEIGLIHRDIKPANILLTTQGGEMDIAKVVDFGLVKEISEPSLALTGSQTLLGTPLYMAPEAIVAPEFVDGRSDLYALGAVGYFMITATDVFDSATVVGLCSQHLHSEPERPSARLDGRLPAEFEQLVMSCLSKDPEERPANGRAVQQILEPIMLRHPWTQSDASLWWTARAQRLADLHGRVEETATPEHIQAEGRFGILRRALNGV